MEVAQDCIRERTLLLTVLNPDFWHQTVNKYIFKYIKMIPYGGKWSNYCCLESVLFNFVLILCVVRSDSPSVVIFHINSMVNK